MDLARLERLHTQVVAPGVVVPITAGRGFIHSTAHLAPLTVTLVVRAVGAGEAPETLLGSEHLGRVLRADRSGAPEAAVVPVALSARTAAR